MSDFAFGAVAKDSSFDNLNVKGTLGQCETKVRARCVVANDMRAGTLVADRILTSELEVEPINGNGGGLVVARAFLSQNLNGFGPNGTIVFDTEEAGNTPGVYNPATGEFTIPTSGRYVVYAQTCAANFSAVPPFLYGFAVTVNTPATNTAKATHVIADLALITLETEKIYWEVNLNAGDVVQVTAIFSGTADIVGGAGFTGVTFGGIRQLIV